MTRAEGTPAGRAPAGTAKVRERAALADYTTLRLGGPARRLAEAATDEQVVAEVRAAATRGVRRGGGRRDRHGNGQDMVELTVAAGEDWDAVVEACVGEGLAGLECLSGIPGRAGATPIQNVGAYGQEVAERIISVRVYDR